MLHFWRFDFPGLSETGLKENRGFGRPKVQNPRRKFELSVVTNNISQYVELARTVLSMFLECMHVAENGHRV